VAAPGALGPPDLVVIVMTKSGSKRTVRCLSLSKEGD